MSGEIKLIKVNNLINYYENPRHGIAKDELDTLKKLFNAVGVQFMLNLATDIQENGLLGNQQIVVVYSEVMSKYVVYEGNRRIAVIKLLLNPERFNFLGKTVIEKVKKIRKQGRIPEEINCYVTDEEEALFIMERLHSGEDKGRGTKQWTSREKEVFQVRRNHVKKISYLIDLYTKKYFKNFEITTVLPFTTIQRIFNNREIKKVIGLDSNDELSFTKDKVQLVLDASKWIKSEAERTNIAVTRMFNKARAIEDILVPWIEEYKQHTSERSNSFSNKETSSEIAISENGNAIEGAKSISPVSNLNDKDSLRDTNKEKKHESLVPSQNQPKNPRSAGNVNTPYFFQGLNFDNLDPNDPETHGVIQICKELEVLSRRRLVETFPLAATFLIRSLIEQTIIYYSKKHKIQGQDKFIWEDISRDSNKLSRIIERYKKGLPNYITDSGMRQYFMDLFGNYENNVDPLNWVVHRPSEYQLGSTKLIELPRNGLLSLINYMLS